MEDNDKEVKTVDVRGLSCPQSVLLTKKALSEGAVVNSPTEINNYIRKY